MGRQSSIRRLPAEVRELIGDLRERGRTIDEVLEKLRELDVEVSRSALGRHVKQLDAIGAEIRRSRTIAEALVRRYGEAPESRTARLNIELMHAFINKLMISEDGEIVSLDAKEAMFVATALQKLAQASKQDLDREAVLRQEFAQKLDRKLAEAEAELADGAGSGTADPKEVLRRIREEVYGIFS
jgi:biotin operon repressor